jgi:hypothetical protein
MLLLPRSRPVGVKTESTAWDGGVQPDGGSCFAAAHADTLYCQSMFARLDLAIWDEVPGDPRDARASPPVITATLHSPLAIFFAASSNNLPGLSPPCSEYLFHFVLFSTPSFSASKPGKSGYGHVHVLTTSMLSIEALISELEDDDASLSAIWIASSINVAGSLASATAVERFLMSPTPTMMGISDMARSEGSRTIKESK